MALDQTDAAARGQSAPTGRAEPLRFDAVVIGTGFGGAVTACRLVEAGFKVCILERGRRYGAADFPTYPTDDLFVSGESTASQFSPPPDFSRWLWSQDHGLYDVRDLGDSVAVQAAGYGGGSLIYVNVHLRPPRDVFDEWPQPYSSAVLEPYFDLAAFMLGVAPVPQRLAKTLQLQRAAKANPDSWFRTPLAVNFTRQGRNAHGRDQNPCDMRARCWRGCDHQAKNTLDLNYLARAEDGGCYILTMAEVTKIERSDNSFNVHYNDLLRPEAAKNGAGQKPEPATVIAPYVFLCAGAINTTDLLFKSREGLGKNDLWTKTLKVLGSRYFPNSDSLAAVFDCDEPHEADYGPTITAAVLYDQSAATSDFRSLAFGGGRLQQDHESRQDAVLTAGLAVLVKRGETLLVTATLAHAPIVDWGSWTADDDANGTLVLVDRDRDFEWQAGDVLELRLHGEVVATANAESGFTAQRHWFLVQDGGYPTDLEPLTGVFRSPLWLRRNRYLEHPTGSPSSATADPGRAEQRVPRQVAPLRRPPTSTLRVKLFAEALGGTSAAAMHGEGAVARQFATDRPMTDVEADTDTDPDTDAADPEHKRKLRMPGLLSNPLGNIFPPFFVEALRNDRTELLAQAAAMAIPVLSRLLDEMSATLTAQIDPETRARLSREEIDDRQVEILARGLVRQVLQILAGSEVTLATKAAEALLNPIPRTVEQLVNVLADAFLWALGYNQNVGHTAVLLTMGRDNFRGRMEWGTEDDRPIRATLPHRVLDTAGAAHERVLREIAVGWRGELRTNPGWSTLNQRVSVHNQGGCPMGLPGRSVTAPDGEVHGCDGLYVMDAAAFPASVGVNPSATITAVAEYKIEQFIRNKRPGWTPPDRTGVADWIRNHGGREAIDPLNAGKLTSRPAPSSEVNVLGLKFDEEMSGFCAPTEDAPISFTPLSRFPGDLTSFLNAESRGITKGQKAVSVCLHVAVEDLARLVSAGQDLSPVKIRLSGDIKLDGAKGKATTIDSTLSFLQIFIDPKEPGKQRRFFYYLLRSGLDESSIRLEGVKVLCDESGFDIWHDTSTLYVQIKDGDQWQRGVLRVSIETFMRKQMPSMWITGTSDPARQSWALLAFYKYFGGELVDIYTKRAEAWKDALIKLVTSIHV